MATDTLIKIKSLGICVGEQSGCFINGKSTLQAYYNLRFYQFRFDSHNSAYHLQLGTLKETNKEHNEREEEINKDARVLMGSSTCECLKPPWSTFAQCT